MEGGRQLHPLHLLPGAAILLLDRLPSVVWVPNLWCLLPSMRRGPFMHHMLTSTYALHASAVRLRRDGLGKGRYRSKLLSGDHGRCQCFARTPELPHLRLHTEPRLVEAAA